MDVNSMNDNSIIRNESNSEDKKDILDEDSVCSSEELDNLCDLQALVFLKNLITSCYPEEVEKSSGRPRTGGVGHMMRAIETLREELQSDRQRRRSDKRQKRSTTEMNKVDLEWVNLVLEFLQSTELRSAMEAIGCASMEKEENESDSSQCTCYIRSGVGSTCSIVPPPRSPNLPHKNTRRKLQKTDGSMPHQCKAHTSSKNLKKLKLASVKYLQRHPSALKTQETQTNSRQRHLIPSKTSSSDDSQVFDVYPHDRVHDDEKNIFCPNAYKKSNFSSQPTHITSLVMDNNFKSSSVPENVIEVSQAPILDSKMPVYISYPQIHFRVQRNMSTQTEEGKKINRQKICSEVSVVRTEGKQSETHKKASKLFNHEKSCKKFSFTVKNEIRKKKNPMTDSTPKILPPPSNKEDVNNTSETVSTNSMDQGECYSPEETNTPTASEDCTSASQIRCPEIRPACLGQKTLSAAFENYIKKKSGRFNQETEAEIPKKSSFSNEENQGSQSDVAKNKIHHETALLKKVDEHVPAFVRIDMLPIQENDLDFPLKQISLSRDSQRHISISLEVAKDIPKGGTKNLSLIKNSRDNSYASMESVIPVNEKVAISAVNLKFEPAKKTSQGEIPTQNPPDPEELNSSALQSRIVSACRKRKYSQSPPEVGQEQASICTLTIQHRPTPFSCHSSKTEQTTTVSERKRSPTPPADDCVARQREGRNRRKKYRKETNKQNLTVLPEGAKESQKGTDNGDKTSGMEEKESPHKIRVQERTRSDLHLKKSRSIALSPVNFGKLVDKTKREEVLQNFSICDDWGNHNKSLRRSLKPQIPEDNTEATVIQERDSKCTEMAINMLLWQKDFFKSHLERLSKICDVLAKESLNPKSSGSSASEDKRRSNKRRKRKRRNQREKLCQVLGRFLPPASDWDEGTLSLSSSSTSMNVIGSYPLWWEPSHSIACRSGPKKRPRKRRTSRALKRERTKSEYEYGPLSGLFGHA